MHHLSTVIALIGLLLPAAALGLDQPDGTTIPSEPGCDGGRPTGLAATFACEEEEVCNIGEVCPSESECDDGVNGTCETTMWHEFNDNTCIPSQMDGLDPRAEASTTPETFSPVCPLTFTVITRGTAIFRDAFGWYNVTGSEPEPSDLHVMLDCDATDGDQVVLDVRSHPEYLSGEIGFFLVTPESLDAPGSCADGDCCASVARAEAGDGQVYYSERQYNPDDSGADSYIHLLIYDSHLWSQKFYFAWEDIYGGSNNDFTDLMTSVSGVECAGGGAPCDTGLDGVCEQGVTQCVSEALECVQLYEPEGERCDGMDNDCNGEVDDGAECPGEDEVCHNGRCVPHCELSDEFVCALGYNCYAETGFCIETACDDVECPSHQVCQGGHCVGGCDDVVCPHGLSCRLGSCLDPCEGVSCGAGQLCSEGVCVNGCGQCNGLICEAPLECDGETGRCLDPSCDTECDPGTHCEAGECVDDCAGAVCPGGQECVDGECRSIDAPGDGGPGDSGPDDGGPSDGGPSDGDPEVVVEQGCSCRAGATTAPAQSALLLLLLTGTLTWLRRR